jgi:hypothetical protein
MKKKLLATLMVCLITISLFPAFAFAKINKTTDKFDGTLKIESDISKGTGIFSFVTFAKFIDTKSNVTYGIFPHMYEYKEWWFFEKTPVEMKVDDNPEIFKLSVLDTYSKMEGTGYSHALITASYIDVNKENLNLIKNAKKLTFRISFAKQPAYVWQVPDKVLKEWQEVINTNK